MRIIVDIGHPAQVHFHRNAIKALLHKGHQILVSAREKDILTYLLSKYGLEYVKISTQRHGIVGLAHELIERVSSLRGLVRSFKPDLLYGPGETVAITGKLTGIPTVIFTDSEPVLINRYLTYPLATTICTPYSFTRDLGDKHVRYNGYKELAYLHPNYFKPDPSVLAEAGLDILDKFIIVRFVSWKASHDIGQHGFDLEGKRRLIAALKEFGKVLVSSESPLPAEFEKYRFAAPPEKIHDLLHYATVFVGDSQTMATEAAVLGTPAIRSNSFVGPGDMGNFLELENKYDLMYSFREPDKAIQKAAELIRRPNLKEEWRAKRERLLKDKIDVTAFLVDFIENYPDSFRKYRRGSNKEPLLS